jgi:hypothetical protein
LAAGVAHIEATILARLAGEVIAAIVVVAATVKSLYGDFLHLAVNNLETLAMKAHPSGAARALQSWVCGVAIFDVDGHLNFPAQQKCA